VLILLDIDGTLVDTNYLHVDAWARAFHGVGLVVPRAAIHRQIGKGSDQFLPVFVKEPQAAERADELHLVEYGKLAEFGFALPGARELLLGLRGDGHALWMATSAKPEEIAQRLDALGVDQSILAGIVSSGDVQRSKREQAPTRGADVHFESAEQPGDGGCEYDGRERHQPDVVQQMNAWIFPGWMREQLGRVDFHGAPLGA